MPMAYEEYDYLINIKWAADISSVEVSANLGKTRTYTI